MNRTHEEKTIFLAFMMATMSLAGCFGNDDGGSNEDETPVETLEQLASTAWIQHRFWEYVTIATVGTNGADENFNGSVGTRRY